jgi:NADH-quinone oxidoreductase subunit F
MDFESLVEAGSALGTGAIIVIDEDSCMVDVARRTARFFAHESCGRCTPCRVGSRLVLGILDGIVAGNARPGDLDRLQSLCANILGNTFCPMGDAMAIPIQSSLQRFRQEYEEHITTGACTSAA